MKYFVMPKKIKQIPHGSDGVDDGELRADRLYYDPTTNEIINTVEFKFKDSIIDIPNAIVGKEEEKTKYTDSFRYIKNLISRSVGENKSGIKTINFHPGIKNLTLTVYESEPGKTIEKSVLLESSLSQIDKKYHGLLVSQAINEYTNQKTQTVNIPSILNVSLRDIRTIAKDTSKTKGQPAPGSSYHRMQNFRKSNEGGFKNLAKFLNENKDQDVEDIIVKKGNDTNTINVSFKKNPHATQNIRFRRGADEYNQDTVVKVIGLFRPEYLDFLYARSLKNTIGLVDNLSQGEDEDKKHKFQPELVKISQKKSTVGNERNAGRKPLPKSQYAVTLNKDVAKNDNIFSGINKGQNLLMLSAFLPPAMLKTGQVPIDPTGDSTFRRNAVNCSPEYFHWNFMSKDEIGRDINTMFGSQHADSFFKRKQKLNFTDLKSVVDQFYSDTTETKNLNFDGLFAKAIEKLKTKNAGTYKVEMEAVASNFAQMAFFCNKIEYLQSLAQNKLAGNYSKIKDKLTNSSELSDALLDIANPHKQGSSPKDRIDAENLASLAGVISANKSLQKSIEQAIDATNKDKITFDDIPLHELAYALDSRIKSELQLRSRSHNSILRNISGRISRETNAADLAYRFDSTDLAEDVKEIKNPTTWIANKDGDEKEPHYYTSNNVPEEKGRSLLCLAPTSHAVLRSEKPSKEPKHLPHETNKPKASFDFTKILNEIIGAAKRKEKDLLKHKQDIFRQVFEKYCARILLMRNPSNQQTNLTSDIAAFDAEFHASLDRNVIRSNGGPDAALFEACQLIFSQLRKGVDLSQDNPEAKLYLSLAKIRLEAYQENKREESEDLNAYYKRVDEIIKSDQRESQKTFLTDSGIDPDSTAKMTQEGQSQVNMQQINEDLESKMAQINEKFDQKKQELDQEIENIKREIGQQQEKAKNATNESKKKLPSLPSGTGTTGRKIPALPPKTAPTSSTNNPTTATVAPGASNNLAATVAPSSTGHAAPAQSNNAPNPHATSGTPTQFVETGATPPKDVQHPPPRAATPFNMETVDLNDTASGPDTNAPSSRPTTPVAENAKTPNQAMQKNGADSIFL